MNLVPCLQCSHQISPAAAACPQCGHPVGSPQVPGGPLAAARAATNPEASIGEETLWEARPSSLLLLGPTLRTVAFLILLAILRLAFESYLLPSLDLPPILTFIMVAGLMLLVFLALARLIQAWVKVKGVRWRLTNQRIVVESGIISKNLENVDVRTIDDTKFRQTIAGRLLGFGSVVVISKDKTNPVLELPGVKQPRKIQELIRSTAYKVSQGQLFMREA